jgi:hypothetical protein
VCVFGVDRSRSSLEERSVQGTLTVLVLLQLVIGFPVCGVGIKAQP